MIDAVFVAFAEVYPYLVAGFLADCIFRVTGRGRLVVRRPSGGVIAGRGWHLVGLTPFDRGYAVSPPRTLEGDPRWTFTSTSGRDTDRFDPARYVDATAPAGAEPAEVREPASFEAFRERRESIAGAERASTWASTVAFVTAVSALPVSLYVVPRDVPGVFEVVMALVVIAHVTAAALAWRLVARLRRASARVPVDSVVALAIYAPTTHHAATRLLRHAYEDADPHLVAAATFGGHRRDAVVRRELWGAAIARARLADEGWRRLWNVRERRVRAAAAALGIDVEGVMRVPDLGSGVRGWCPACGSAFRLTVEICPDCAMPVVDAAGAGTSLAGDVSPAVRSARRHGHENTG